MCSYAAAGLHEFHGARYLTSPVRLTMRRDVIWWACLLAGRSDVTQVGYRILHREGPGGQGTRFEAERLTELASPIVKAWKRDGSRAQAPPVAPPEARGGSLAWRGLGHGPPRIRHELAEQAS